MKKNRGLLILGMLLIAILALAACTAPGGTVQEAIENAAPTLQAAVEEVAPTLQAAATELAPTVAAVVEEVAPTVEAAATEMAGGETAEPSGDLMVVSADCDAEGYTGLFKEIAAIDPMTVQFSMCAPDPAFPSKAAFSSFAIQPSEYLESTGGTGELLERPIGTGPYMINQWNRGEELTFTKNPNYWGEPAAADNLVFRWQTESAARLL